MVIQQGDVIVELVDGIPLPQAKKLKHTTLAEGEVTGHSHVAIGDEVELFEDTSGTLWLSAPHGAEVKHQEHHQVTLPKGTLKVCKVREYDHFAEEARLVRD